MSALNIHNGRINGRVKNKGVARNFPTEGLERAGASDRVAKKMKLGFGILDLDLEQ